VFGDHPVEPGHGASFIATNKANKQVRSSYSVAGRIDVWHRSSNNNKECALHLGQGTTHLVY